MKCHKMFFKMSIIVKQNPRWHPQISNLLHNPVIEKYKKKETEDIHK